MLDYAYSKDERKDFILYYEDKGENLQVYLANGDDYPVPNTLENENKLLSQMEEQVKDVWSFKSKKEKAKKSNLFWAIYDLVFLTINTVFMITNPGVVTGVCIGLFILCGAVNVAGYKNNKRILEDINKNQLFINNKKRINEFLERGNEEIKEDTINPVKVEKKPILTINDVHHLEYEDVNRIVSDINRDEKFGIDRPKVLTMRYLPAKKNSK